MKLTGVLLLVFLTTGWAVGCTSSTDVIVPTPDPPEEDPDDDDDPDFAPSFLIAPPPASS